MDQHDETPAQDNPEHGPQSDPTTQHQQHAEHLARYGAPVPPPPLPWAGSDDWPTAPHTAPHPTPHRRRGKRAVALGAALGVVAAAGGAGFALGHVGDHASATAGASPNAAAGQNGQNAAPGQEGQPFQGSPFGGTNPYGGTDPFSGGGGSGSPFSSANSGTPATKTQLTGLVRISSTLKYEGGLAAGTGMILTSTGEVITNHHVVQGSTKLRVTVMTTGKTYAATVVGTDAKDDVAVLQLSNASGLATVTTDNDPVAVGDSVTAVGDANGDTSTFSAATGTIAATGQSITTNSEDGRSGEKLQGMLKIDADVISGDSGGATYDSQGEVLGMTTAASTGSANVTGYAIPIAKVLRIATDLENGTQNARYDYGSPAFLGLGLTASSARVAAVYPGTPAARAGITAGDTITRVGTTRVRSATQLRSAITAYSPGQRVQIAWTDRSGTSHIASVTLIAGPIA